MNNSRRLLTIIAIVSVAAISQTSQASAAEPVKVSGPVSVSDPVTVSLESGRQFTAEVDGRTDADHLWLRFEGRSTILRRPIEWSKIAKAEYQGLEIDRDDFQSLAKELAEEAKESDAHRDWSSNLAESNNYSGHSYADLAREALTKEPRVTSIRVDAFAANWDADVQTDGIVVRLTAIDAQGRAVAVDGTLEVELIASRPIAVTTKSYAQGRDLGPAFVRIGRWSRHVDQAASSTGTAEFRLPFQAAKPDLDLELGSLGLVTAKLSVAGSGLFQASDPNVGLREFSPLRNQREFRDGTRFFPIEQLRKD